MTEIKHAVLIVIAIALTADNLHVTGRTSCEANLTTTPADPGGEMTVTLNRKTHTGERVSDVAERVKKIVVEHFASTSRYIDECQVTENARFINLGANIVDMVALTMAFELEFGCEIPDDAAEKFVTVKDAISFIESHS